MFRTARTCFSILFLSLLLINPCWAAATPMATLQETVTEVMEILKTGKLETATTRTELAGIIRDSFDFKSMAQRILARNWKKTSPQERDKFIGLLAELLENSYIGNIEAYTDEKVEFVKERIKKKNAAIDTLIVTKTKEIPVSYRMIQRGETWKVYDVIVESVSFVNSYRDSYGQIIKKSGMSGLLAKMEEKLALAEEK